MLSNFDNFLVSFQSNAVTAFEQNLVNVSQKLQKMTTSTDEKV